ncbi:DUF1963 domain-containing protein [Bradyrhizobium sp. JYMT SZCCT0180]|uniref:DUF1963 domain-containing protein n=1 Tax=Bradyrhizobium sp. JYMT SZCCT0180 TaxID=2807666 RepID=UPI001BA46DC5|nr:DUF1963 domain-containing protein [Bradyrhizobium sp. JYMT SZCCT0180]MBR1209739.1 DUF1963 domain-containing protein [Bradyrhizobium sp. JYMT SZCCT0180]
MASLKPLNVAAITIAAVMALVIFRGIATGAWIPWGAAIFIAITLGIVAATLVALLPGNGSDKQDKPASTPAISARAASPSIAPTAGVVRQDLRAASVRIEPARTAIVFLQQMPPSHDPRHLSYFGGLPTAPRSFTWPTWTHKGATEPLHFVMQIDCAAVPASARHEAFPSQGVLYFFLDLRWGHSNGFRVLYTENAMDAMAQAPAPANLAAVYGSEARHAWRWTEALDDPDTRLPKLLLKWPFDPLAIAIPPALIEAWRSEIDEENENPVFWWPELRAMDAVLLEAQEARRGVAAPPDDAAPKQAGISRPYATYPQDWCAIEIGAGLVLGYVNRELRYAGTSYRLRAMTAEDIQAMSERIGLEARQWLVQAAQHAPFAATSEQTRDSFWSWLEGWRDFSAVVIQQAARLSIEAALAESAEAASRIPKEAIARIEATHALATRAESGIFAATPDRMLAPPGYVQGNEEETAGTHLLLLELSSDEGLGHHFGEGVYQFWILPDDLRTRRFDRVLLTTTGY